jgi:hypothetical protein
MLRGVLQEAKGDFQYGALISALQRFGQKCSEYPVNIE